MICFLSRRWDPMVDNLANPKALIDEQWIQNSFEQWSKHWSLLFLFSAIHLEALKEVIWSLVLALNCWFHSILPGSGGHRQILDWILFWSEDVVIVLYIIEHLHFQAFIWSSTRDLGLQPPVFAASMRCCYDLNFHDFLMKTFGSWLDECPSYRCSNCSDCSDSATSPFL